MRACVFWQRVEGVLSARRRARPRPSPAGAISNILVMGILVEQLLPVLQSCHMGRALIHQKRRQAIQRLFIYLFIPTQTPCTARIMSGYEMQKRKRGLLL